MPEIALPIEESVPLTAPSPTSPVVRPGILAIQPYIGGESKAPGASRIIRLASNEGALGPSLRAIEAYRALSGEIHRYPDGNSVALRRALAERYALESADIICGAGSDDLLFLLLRAYAGPGDEVLYSRHGFSIYPIGALGVGATPVAAPETDLTTDVDALLAAVTPHTTMVFIANPNNPTGTYLPAAELRRLRAGLAPHIVLVIDAAYAEYVTEADYEPGIELVRAGNNTVMTRTFSKIYALGGLRLGWAYAPPEIADVLNRLRAPFNVSSAASAAGVAAVEDTDFIARSVVHNAFWRAWTDEALTRLGLTVVPSAANFVLVQLPAAPERNAAAAFEHLKANGILTRKVAGYHLPAHLRITIGTEPEMRAVVATLGAFLGR